MNREIDNKAKSYLHSITVLGTVAMLSLIVAVVVMFWLSISGVHTRLENYHTVIPDSISICSDDIAGIEGLNAENPDSVAAVLKNLAIIQAELDRRQRWLATSNDKIVEDLRQETNNTINKVNSWLGFWIALIGIFGVVTPAIAEYKFKVFNEKELEVYEDRFNELMRRIGNECKKSKSLRSKIENQRPLLELQSSLRALSLCLDVGLVKKLTNRTDYVRTLIRSFILNLKKVAFGESDDLATNINPDDAAKVINNRDIIVRALISLYKFLHSIKINVADFHTKGDGGKLHFTRVRELDRVMDLTRLLVSRFICTPIDDVEALASDLHKLTKMLDDIFLEY